MKTSGERARKKKQIKKMAKKAYAIPHKLDVCLDDDAIAIAIAIVLPPLITA